MATELFTGSSGVVYSGSTAIASIRSFSIEENQEVVDATHMNVAGVTFRTNLPTFKNWTASMEVFWTVDDGAGIANKTESGMLQPGSQELTFHFWPAGDAQYELGYTGNAYVTSRSISSSVDGVVEASITISGTGPITTENGVV